MAENTEAPAKKDTAAEIKKYKAKESSLSSTELKEYIGLIEQANKLDPAIQQQQVAKFSSELTQALQPLKEDIKGKGKEIGDIVAAAAQRFIIERKTGEQGLGDFLRDQTGLADSIIQPKVKSLAGRLPEFLNVAGAGEGMLQDELGRVNALYTQRQKDESAEALQKQQFELASQQRGQAGDLLNQALSSLNKPADPFSPELNSAVLDNLRKGILDQGERSFQNTEAAMALRNLTGSSIEGAALSQTEGSISDTLANATLNFLLQSGQAGERNRQFIASSLAQQANSLLGASQQSQGTGVGLNVSQQGLDLQRTQLQNQIMQFNQQFQEAQRQFSQNMDFQRQQSEQDMGLLLQRMNQGAGKDYSGIGSMLGMGLGLAGTALLPGAGTVAGYTLGASLGAGMGSGLGILYGQGR